MTGLPPHIAQIIAGHKDINVTLGYKAVYPDEAIQAHLAFLARRRALRPTDEYRVPTDQEWQEFLGHFERRKVATGICGRAFGTPCIHEHGACAAVCTGHPPASGTASPRSATTSSPASPKPSAKDGSARSKDSRSASPAPKTSCQPGHRPHRHHRGHQRRRLPAHPEGRRDHNRPPKPSTSTASIRTKPDIRETRRSPTADPPPALWTADYGALRWRGLQRSPDHRHGI